MFLYIYIYISKSSSRTSTVSIWLTLSYLLKAEGADSFIWFEISRILECHSDWKNVVKAWQQKEIGVDLPTGHSLDKYLGFSQDSLSTIKTSEYCQRIRQIVNGKNKMPQTYRSWHQILNWHNEAVRGRHEGCRWELGKMYKNSYDKYPKSGSTEKKENGLNLVEVAVRSII